MSKLLAALVASAFAFGSTAVLANNHDKKADDKKAPAKTEAKKEEKKAEAKKDAPKTEAKKEEKKDEKKK